MQSVLIPGKKIIIPNMEASDSYLKRDLFFICTFCLCNLQNYEFEVASKFVPRNKQGRLKC